MNRVVFAFWGAEENDLDGSKHYVDELSKAEKDQTAAYLNVDMAASPNGVRSFHDGDGSDFGDAGPEGSDGIENVFERYFKENALPAESTVFDGGSDYQPFLRAGIPVGGLFSGDVEKKIQAQVQSYGGVAGKVPRFLLPRSLRHHQQHQRGPAQGNVRRNGLRHCILRTGRPGLTSPCAAGLGP